MARLGLIAQTELARWADTREAQGDLPRLIRRLILETGRGVVQLGFPAGEGITTRSWDGTVRATEATAFIPLGLSLWELSVQKKVKSKADKDYAKRLETPDGSLAAECTYVAVFPRRWAKRFDWGSARSLEGRWKSVRAYGIDDLEAWLEVAPITHAWLSEMLGFHPHGLLTAESWWTAWSEATKPSLSAAVVLAGRREESDALRARLAGPGQLTTVQGASCDDVVAFLSALAVSDAETQNGLLSRMALIDKVEAWRRLREHPVPLVLVPRTQEVTDDIGSRSVHHLIVPIVDEGPADVTLKPIDSKESRNALVAGGLDERLAEEAGKLARLSLLAARRRIARKPELHRPTWAKAPVPRLLRRAMLVGRWNERSPDDIAVVSTLFGAEYDSVRDGLASFMSRQDPPLVRLGSAIGLVSHVDAWLLLRGELRKEDLELFQSEVLTVFVAVDPALELPPEDRWKAAVLGERRAHSSDIRLGLATSLALLGSYGDMIVAGSGLIGQEWASWTLRRIFEAANQDRTCQLWASLRDVLTLFAEAAPTTFLDAVRDGLQGNSPLLQGIFTDSRESNALFADSPHSSLLWALETCAWSSENFGQTIDLLARLAEIDPGGRLGNRPAGCLAHIFCPWYPQNSVSVERRLAVLDGLRTRHVAIAWQLMLSMMPDIHGGTAMHMSGPHFRDWRPQKIIVTHREYWNHIEEVCHRLLEDVGTDPTRWSSLLRELPNLSSQWRAELIERLGALTDDERFDEQARAQLWESLRFQAAHHRKFIDAKWSLPLKEIDRLDQVGARFQPSAPSKQFAWLFVEYMPDISGLKPGTEAYDTTLARIRAEAAGKISMSLTWPERRNFATSTKLPASFGWSLAQSNMDMFDAEVIELLKSDESANFQFASGYLAKRFRDEGWPWVERHVRKETLSPEQVGRLLLVTDDFPRAWEVAEATDGESAAFFWRNFRTSGLGADFSFVEFVAQKLLQVGRPGGALSLLALYRRQDGENGRAELMAICLEELLRRDVENSDARGLSHYDLAETFSYLERSTLSRDRLAKLEWAYLEIFDFDSSPSTLSAYLAQDPSFFVEAVSLVYRPRPLQVDGAENPSPEPERELAEARAALAQKAYQLLSGWKTVPGAREDGSVDGELLSQWVHGSRTLLREVHRLEVGDLHIGGMLASAPTGTDGLWPCVEVRDLLETLQAAKVEDGLRLQIHNSRGVTMRGMLDGGDKELELAANYRTQADQFADRWPRTAAVLRGLAQDYELEARRYEEDAERRRKGFES